MSTLASDFQCLLAKVGKTPGFKVDMKRQRGATVRAVDDEGHTVAHTSVNPQPKTAVAYKNQITRIRREVGWTIDLYQQATEQDKETRMAKATAAAAIQFSAAEKAAQQASPPPPEPQETSMTLPNGATVTFEKITPTKAYEFLEKNIRDGEEDGHRQRKLRQATVAKYVAALERGEFQKVTHQGIAFDWNGHLLDGQYRLNAIFDSGVTVWMLVTRGLDPETFRHIDQGKPRDISDVLGIKGYDKNPALLASSARLIDCFERVPQTTVRGRSSWARHKLAHIEIEDVIERHPGLVDAMPLGQRLARGAKMTPTAGTVGVYLAKFVWPQAPIEDFVEKMATGAGLPKGDPALTLRKYFWTVDNRPTPYVPSQKNDKTIFQLALFFRAWNHDCVGKTWHRVSYKNTLYVPHPYSPTRAGKVELD